MLPRLLAGIGHGDRLRDKLAISLLVARAGLLPLGSLLRRFGLSLPDPGRLITTYTCRTDGLVYGCPGGAPYFLFCDRQHDPGVRAAVDSLISGTFIDVGAHVGFFTLPAARRLVDLGRVIAIEPHPARFRFLRENVARNGLANVDCLPCAVGEREGTATLYDLDASLVPHPRDVSLEHSHGRPFRVPLRTIDGLCEEAGISDITLVKIDVEGFEPQVLRGMRSTLARWKPSVVFEALTADSLSASSQQLAQHGYAVRQVDETNYLADP
jgi:FkbM family methyltransferase